MNRSLHKKKKQKTNDYLIKTVVFIIDKINSKTQNDRSTAKVRSLAHTSCVDSSFSYFHNLLRTFTWLYFEFPVRRRPTVWLFQSFKFRHLAVRKNTVRVTFFPRNLTVRSIISDHLLPLYICRILTVRGIMVDAFRLSVGLRFVTFRILTVRTFILNSLTDPRSITYWQFTRVQRRLLL